METRENSGSPPEGGRRRRIFTRFTSGTAVAGEQEPADFLERLEAEIALLREDNARLRLGQAQPPGAGRLVERMRVLAQQRADDQSDETWQALSEAMVVRNVLVDVCAEIGQVVVTLQSRLDNMAPQAGAAGEAADGVRQAGAGEAAVGVRNGA